jgi:hypothetical protein
MRQSLAARIHTENTVRADRCKQHPVTATDIENYPDFRWHEGLNPRSLHFKFRAVPSMEEVLTNAFLGRQAAGRMDGPISFRGSGGC